MSFKRFILAGGVAIVAAGVGGLAGFQQGRDFERTRITRATLKHYFRRQEGRDAAAAAAHLRTLDPAAVAQAMETLGDIQPDTSTVPGPTFTSPTGESTESNPASGETHPSNHHG